MVFSIGDLEAKGTSQRLCQPWFAQALFELAPDEGCRRIELINLLVCFAENYADVVQIEKAVVFR